MNKSTIKEYLSVQEIAYMLCAEELPTVIFCPLNNGNKYFLYFQNIWQQMTKFDIPHFSINLSHTYT